MMTGVGESAVQNAAVARAPRTAKRPPIDLAASSIEIDSPQSTVRRVIVRREA
jgi:hypothetical protein